MKGRNPYPLPYRIDSFSILEKESKMAKQVFASMDLVRHIYSYGPEHREKWSQVGENLKNPSIKDLRLEHVFLPYHVTMDHVVQYFKDIRCRCCSRHSHRKTYPVINNQVLCIAPAYSKWVPEEKNLRDCDCICRQVSRIFVKDLLTHNRDLF